MIGCLMLVWKGYFELGIIMDILHPVYLKSFQVLVKDRTYSIDLLAICQFQVLAKSVHFVTKIRSPIDTGTCHLQFAIISFNLAHHYYCPIGVLNYFYYCP